MKKIVVSWVLRALVMECFRGESHLKITKLSKVDVFKNVSLKTLGGLYLLNAFALPN